MTPAQAKAAGFTHHAAYFGIPCWFADEGDGCLLEGKNWFWNLLIEPTSYLEGLFAFLIFGPERAAVFQIELREAIE